MPSSLSALTGREKGDPLIKVFIKVTEAVRQRTDYKWWKKQTETESIEFPFKVWINPLRLISKK